MLGHLIFVYFNYDNFHNNLANVFLANYSMYQVTSLAIGHVTSNCRKILMGWIIILVAKVHVFQRTIITCITPLSNIRDSTSVYCVCRRDYMSMGCVCMVADNLIKSPHTTASIDIALTLTTLK